MRESLRKPLAHRPQSSMCPPGLATSGAGVHLTFSSRACRPSPCARGASRQLVAQEPRRASTG
eukprot:1280248-Pyramimonas_sp.AAC.1